MEDASDTNSKSRISFQNENANKTNSNFEGKDVDEDDWKKEQSRTKQIISLKFSKTKIR